VTANGPDRRTRLGRARLYLVAGPETGGPGWLDAARLALASRAVDVLQLRVKGVGDDEVVTLARALRPACDAVGALLIVNDLASLAAPAGADGAHVGEHDLLPGLARALLGPERLLGLSTHDAAEVRAAHDAGLDYVGLGPCFATTSKSLARDPGGPDLVEACLQAAHGLAVFPIGGLTEETLPRLVRVGARRAAVGSAVLRAPDPAQAALRLAALLPPRV
jgi:thiamine-phosphate pyrophosphorylase